MKPWWFKRVDAWKTYWLGEPCPKHPGHRVREHDVEGETQCAMMPNMCSECWAEFKEKYEI